MTERRDLQRLETIASVLRQARFSVVVTSKLGGGFPHLIIGARGTCRFAYVKPTNERLSEEETEFREAWTGPPILILHDAAHALGEVGLWMGRRMPLEVSP